MVLVVLGQDYCLNSGQERMDSCLLRDAECESVLWDCPTYASPSVGVEKGAWRWV